MRFNDAVIGLILILFAIAEMAYTRTFPSLHGQAYGPGLFPMLIGAGLVVCGLILVARGLLQGSESGKQSVVWMDLGPWAKNRSVRVNGLLLIACLVAYILLSDTVGFILLSLFILLVLLHRMGVGLWQSIMVACSTTLVLQLLFAKFLLVPLPAGWLQGLVW